MFGHGHTLTAAFRVFFSPSTVNMMRKRKSQMHLPQCDQSMTNDDDDDEKEENERNERGAGDK